MDVSEMSRFIQYVILISESLLVVLLAVIFFLLENKSPFKKLKWIYRQIIIGVVFGGAAIFGTEMGLDVGTSIINVRDAAPLVAGLIFGGPAGVIAGAIGSIERLMSSLIWYKGTYAMTACVIATFTAGLYAWALRKWFFENKTPNFLFGFATASIMEVLHFIILYITKIQEPQAVLDIISEITIPMIVANGVGVSLACLAINLLEYEFKSEDISSRRKSINSKIQLHLLILILATAFTSTSFVVAIQTNYANQTAENALASNISDAGSYVREQIQDSLYNDSATFAKEFDFQYKECAGDINEALKMTDLYCVNLPHTQLNIVALSDGDGYQEGQIIASTKPEYVNKNVLEDKDDFYLADGHDAIIYNDEDSDFLTSDSIENTPRHFESIFYESNFYKEELTFSNYSLKEEYGYNTYLQVVLNVTGFYDFYRSAKDWDHGSLLNLIEDFTIYRRVYLEGFLLIYDADYNIVSYLDEVQKSIGADLSKEDITAGPDYNEYHMYEHKIFDKKSYYMFYEYETFHIVGVIPTTDVTAGRNMMMIVYTFMLTFIYATIFFVSYILIKQLVIKNLRKINATLALIIKGDLNKKVDANSSREFEDLSRDINITVDTLKQYIKDAEARIDKELAFARSIQSSSLPSVFPAFPGVKEFDIYATMNTAKEVGGDFYDFYFVDMTHIAFLVADVSGKGIPASMFMMESKALIKNTLTAIKDIEVLFNRVNESLSQGNEANMFVTCWMGILDLCTGVVEYVNAGHNAPIIYRSQVGKWEYLKEEHKDLVLAGLPTTKYHKQTITLSPGDKIYLYTDGVTEATRGDKTLYGEQRLLNYLNKQKTFNQYKLLAGIQKDIDKFVAGADQFDDITMLVFDFKQTRH